MVVDCVVCNLKKKLKLGFFFKNWEKGHLNFHWDRGRISVPEKQKKILGAVHGVIGDFFHFCP